MADNSDIVQRQLDTAVEEPSLEIVRTVADLKGTDETELGSIWDCTDHVLDGLFSEPPSADAQMAVEFSYEGYRITVHQDGTATFLETS